jgi:hypothetical protein
MYAKYFRLDESMAGEGFRVRAVKFNAAAYKERRPGYEKNHFDDTKTININARERFQRPERLSDWLELKSLRSG